MLAETHWGELDYLIIDLPPGTGDIQLTLAQSVPVTGAVVVTTPQDIALIDAQKGLKTFQKTHVPVLGVIENMGIHICPCCGHEEHVFGEGGGQRLCDKFGVEFLGSLPLDAKIRQEADSGTPTAAADPESPAARHYAAIARRIAEQIARLPRDMTHKFPNIVVSS
jgi:ATP-binding protein involved in chromosome partitioning